MDIIRPEKYRLYVDEVGNADADASENPNHRYLSLTGVMARLSIVRDVIAPELEAMKKDYFNSHPDEPVILHRKEIVNRRFPFQALKDRDVEARFNDWILQHLAEWEYSVITVVIDKLELIQRYRTWHADPYHYCLRVLMERYVMELTRLNAVGDVMAEARGGKEDMRLKRSFRLVWENGTEYVSADDFETRITSKELKVKLKTNNIAGLQLADILAHPSHRATLARNNHEKLPVFFGAKIATILETSKYVRSDNGRIMGYGRKVLP